MRSVLFLGLVVLPAAAHAATQGAASCSTAAAAASTTTKPSGGGQFGILAGRIYDPNNQQFVARGINVDTGSLGDASKILAAFPGLNFIRLAVINNGPGTLPNPATFQNFINTMSAHGVVVEIEDHPWGSGPNPQPAPYTGQQLAQEAAWYGSAAAMYKSNPYVWFGTMNEPENGQGFQDQISATYNAIRGTGSNAIMMAEAGIGGGNPQTVGEGGGYGQVVDTQAGFANFTNVAWDIHYYGGWGSNTTTDVSALQSALYGSAGSHTGLAAAATITDAGGAIPVIIGETGYAATGVTDGVQVLQAAYNNAWTSGAVAWGWNPSPMPGAGDAAQSAADNLSDGGGNLTTYGKIVAAYIAGQAGCQPIPQPIGTNTVVNVDPATLNLPTAPTAPSSTLSVDAPATVFTPAQQAQGSLAVSDTPVSIDLAANPAAPVSPPATATGSTTPLNYLDQSSWWAANPAAAIAERALCSSSNANQALWSAYCGMAGGN